MSEKLDPYMQPIFDAILERMDAKKLDTLIRNKVSEIAPVAFMRADVFKCICCCGRGSKRHENAT